MASDENQWRSPTFRQSVVAKIDEAIARSGMPTNKNSVEMEAHVFQKAKTKEEYLAFVARLILHVREMKSKSSGNISGPAPTGQMMQDPINALQTLARQGNNQMMGMNPNVMNIPQEMQAGVNVGMVRQPNPQNTASNLLQSLNQRPSNQMMTAAGMQGIPNKMGPGTGMGGVPNSQIQNMQGPMGGPGVAMGISMGNQMMNQMQGRKPTDMMMATSGPQPQQQQQAPSAAAAAAAAYLSVAAAGGAGVGVGGPRLPPPPPNQFMQSPSSPSSLAAGRSPAAMAMSPAGMVGSIGTPRSNGMVQSPGTSLNTPVGMASSPCNMLEDQQYREKVRQLSKYIEPLRRMIARMGNDDGDKLSKMKKLLEILSNPTKRMPLDTLRKCEVVLEKLDFNKQHRSDGGSVGPYGGQITTIKEIGTLSPLLDIVSTCLQSSSCNHTLHRTFGPALDTLFGPDIKYNFRPLSIAMDTQPAEESGKDVSEVLQGEIARLDQRFKVSLDGTQHPGSAAVRLICWLDDKHLPAVPPMYVSVPADYPRHPPRCNSSWQQDMLPGTDFLAAVDKALTLRVRKLPSRFSLSQLLDAWEMSVRQACATVNLRSALRAN